MPRLLTWSLASVLGVVLLIQGSSLIFGPLPSRPAARGPARARAAAPSANTAATGAEAPGRAGPPDALTRKLATPPDPRGAYLDLLRAIWEEDCTLPEGFRLGAASSEMHRSLHQAFPRPPSQVEVLQTPHPGTSGLFTARVTDDQGGKGMLGLRLLRVPDSETTWEVESLVVISPARRDSPPGD